MSTDQTCNSSFWSKEEDKILENTVAIYFTEDGDLLTKMEEALPWKSRDDIINHYKILLEDVEAIDSGRVPLPNYPEMQSHSNQKSRSSKTDLQWRRGVAWTEEEHRSFLQGLAKYGRSDWRSISRHCVISRTPTQVASHAQKYFNRLKAANKENRRASIHDTTNLSAEAAGTSQVRSTENMIWRACEGSHPVASTSTESMFFRESTNVEQVTAVAGGGSSHHSAAFVDGMNCLSPDENDEFILHIDDLIVEPEDANGSGFPVDAGRSLLPNKQPCTAASTETESHPIIRIGSELEALIAAYADEGKDIPSIFDAWEAPTSHAMLCNATHSGMCSYPVANVAPHNTVAASGMWSYPVASFSANNAPKNTLAAHRGIASFAVSSIGANNAPQNTWAAHRGIASFAVSSIGANNAPQNTWAAHSGMTSSAVASIGANNAPRNTMDAHIGITNCAVANIGANNAPWNTMDAHIGITNCAVASIGANNAPWNMASCAAASIGAYNAPRYMGPSYRGMTSFGASSLGAYNAPQTMMGAHSRMASFAVASFSANNAPPQNIVAAHSGTTSFVVASFDATNATQNTVAAHAQLPPVAPSSNFGGGEWPNLNSTIHDKAIFDLDDLFTD